MVIAFKMSALENGTAYRVLSCYSKHMVDYAMPIIFLKLKVEGLKLVHPRLPQVHLTSLSYLAS